MALYNKESSSSLAVRLGYRRDDRLLIINCDDLGSSHSANIATFRSMTYGVATSATLMVPCPWAREAAYMFQGLSVGVHLTLTSEYRGYRWRGLTGGASLRDKEGFFPATTRNALDQISAAEARAELRTQIETAHSWSVDVTHLDVHMDFVQGRSDLYDLYFDLAEEFRLPVRMILRKGAKEDVQARARAKSRGLLFADRVIYPWPRRTRDVFAEEIPKLAAGVTEIFAHPVLDGEELRAYDRTYADLRAHDALCLIDPELSDLLNQNNIKRVSYCEIRELQRSDLPPVSRNSENLDEKMRPSTIQGGEAI